ncbi:hypothetical protein [Calditerrivibrio nitroreducens]|uniref:Uncharacterized protein n=1 Tax=Calditerrivibrio nitroreducens (strain DSM 19672 / NBRC 101217 / Yu37-1) TaxID=768670 RepID=E4TG53_CALNY|nr:hypothetical protein [Calditerrivibrio nitroreducens]ADR18603.1 hypothetical protein Calni_0692 [Calditerrivibrio nitroreducens DSM 19672]
MRQENTEIVAGVVFDRGDIKPRWFFINGRKINVLRVIYKWHEREGYYLIYKFTVTDGENIYEIAFNSNLQKWFLIAVVEGVS